MSISGKASELAAELKNCEEVTLLREASKEIEKSEANIKMLDDFRKIQMEAYSEQMQNGEVSEKTKQKFKNIGSVVSMNPSVNKYIQTEQRFSIMWQNVLKMLNDAIGIDFSFGTGKNKK
ncbi:YlbF family regulator [Clostridium sp. AWRP]|uniref:YlbF family regulator n=1 Tax=Clostridium sp. AWRP TaxID=2212991 RepID=UPI000FD72E07|nr:YlbF family regulator [Clostridium sp. AWRP]AZV56217.1 YlbF family regulator [Clostridium sp. AWRP]